EEDKSQCGSLVTRIKFLVEGNYTANFLAVVVLFDAYCTANDIDSRAAGVPTSQFIL
ncbi:unnamed protein product, partial [Effrenium voratum]